MAPPDPPLPGVAAEAVGRDPPFPAWLLVKTQDRMLFMVAVLYMAPP